MMAGFKSVYRKLRWRLFWCNFQLPSISLKHLAPNAELVEPLITEQLCLPPYEGPNDHDDAVPLFTLVHRLQPKVVLELGTAHGATAANICAISNATVYTVNALPEQICGNLITFTLDKNKIGCIYKKYGYESRVVQILENTWRLDLTRYLPPSSVDFALIDACHDADFVVNDFLCVLPVLRERAVVMFHDVHPSMQKHLRESYLACMYLRKQGFNLKHVENTWWAIWQAQDAGSKSSAMINFANTIDGAVIRTRGQGLAQDMLYFRWLADLYHL